MKPLSLIEKAFLLKKTRLFGSLDLDLLLTISDKMEMLFLQKGEQVFSEGQDAHKMYLVVEGLVGIEHNAQQKSLKSGQFFGDESLFNEKPRAYSAEAKTETTLLILSRPHLLSVISECPSVAVALLEAYSENVEFRQK